KEGGEGRLEEGRDNGVRTGEGAMKVRFQQSGGFAGLIRGAEVDAGSLEPEAKTALEQLLAHKTPRTKGLMGASPARDTHQFTITVEDEGKARTFTFDDGVPEAVQPLIRDLQKQARPMPL